MRTLRALAAILAYSLAAPAAAQTPASTTPTATQIYFLALHHMQSLPVPPFLEYKIVWDGPEIDANGAIVIPASHSVWNNIERTADAVTWSREDPADFNARHDTQIEAATVPVEVFARRKATVASVLHQNAPIFDDISSEGDGLKTIASVESESSLYNISLVDHEWVTGCPNAYHLRLQPRRERDRNNLRALWIDPSSYRICRLLIQGNLWVDDVHDFVPMTMELDDHGLLEGGDMAGTVLYGQQIAYEAHMHVVAVTSKQAEPEYLFDTSLWLQHLAAHGTVPFLPSPVPSPVH